MLLEDFNATAVRIPERTVVQLFEEQVDRTPNAAAVQFGEHLLSYIELDQRANQLGRYLKQKGIGPDVLVGLCLNRSLDMVVALLGILKSGGAYVPLDPSYPADRRGFMLQDAQISILLTEASLRGSVREPALDVVTLDDDWNEICTHPVDRLESCAHAFNLAYVIYTSGSTGTPKGVAISHGALANHMQWIQREFGFHSQDRLLQKTPVSFDASVWEFYAPLLSGGRLVMLEPDSHRDPRLLVNTIVDREITIIQMVPAVLSALLNAESLRGALHLRQVFCGGEAFSAELARQIWAQVDVEAVNLYGPTEGTIDTTFWRGTTCEAGGNVPIGRPVSNVQTYVLDEHMELAPVGVPGELYIGGEGLARGYVNRPGLTAERFLPNPYGEPGVRMYRTGDLVRWLADGSLEYLGRLDQQVKIRGFRIELGEIETALQQHEGVQQAVVIAREDEPGDKRLVAYLVHEQGGHENGNGRAELPMNDLREYLLSRLPEYMVPAAYVQLEKIPLNHSGKIDRKNLPPPEADTPEQEYVGPRNPTEETLCRLWQELLRRERVGIHDNFFNIGGHSLMAAQLATRIRGNLNVDIPLRTVFESPTIAQLAQSIGEVLQTAATSGVSSQLRPAIKRVARKTVLLNAD